MSYYDWGNGANISEMVGRTFTRVVGEAGDSTIIFENETERYVFFHSPDCCESVNVEDIIGDLQDLVGSPLLLAEESSGDTPSDHKFEYEPESYTWTFYKFATIKGYVDVRWLGTSNGYYSEGVSLGKEKV
jgi:hypothetical protein